MLVITRLLLVEQCGTRIVILREMDSNLLIVDIKEGKKDGEQGSPYWDSLERAVAKWLYLQLFHISLISD